MLSVDWGAIAGNINYPMSVLMTSEVGSRLAKVLGNIVRLGIVAPNDIHLIGHSLGAHIAGACGSWFSSNKIGRITGRYVYHTINLTIADLFTVYDNNVPIIV